MLPLSSATVPLSFSVVPLAKLKIWVQPLRFGPSALIKLAKNELEQSTECSSFCS
jgi:hypothetical protein